VYQRKHEVQRMPLDVVGYPSGCCILEIHGLFDELLVDAPFHDPLDEADLHVVVADRLQDVEMESAIFSGTEGLQKIRKNPCRMRDASRSTMRGILQWFAACSQIMLGH
jgi:hypothetical protein